MLTTTSTLRSVFSRTRRQAPPTLVKRTTLSYRSSDGVCFPLSGL
jgi:hypothetical protein